MKYIDIEYEVEKESHVPLFKIFDMFRYSGDSVLKIRNPSSWVMLHHRHYEDEDHKRRIIEHFKGQILGRWGSFGCSTKIIRGLEE